MMKHKLYLWNDLDFFLNCNLDVKIDFVWDKFVEYTKANKGHGDVEYFCFDRTLSENWINRIKFDNTCLISIGTRPDIILNKIHMGSYESIRPYRNRSINGASNFVTMSLHDKNVLYQCSKRERCKIQIIEDAIVNGKTIEYILDIIESAGFHGIVIIEAYFANRNACQKLLCKYSFKLEFNISVFMEGKPIEESTLICLYDLLFGYITDGVRYYERMDLITKYLPNEKNQLHDLIMECIELLSN